MTSSKSKLFKVELLLERPQKKILDAVLEECRQAIHSALREGLQRTEDLKMLVQLHDFEEMLEKPDFCHPDLTHETRKELAKIACDKYARVITDGLSARNTKQYAMACVLHKDSVMFAISEKTVQIPYLGMCKFVYNNKAMLVIDGLIATKAGQKYFLGYWMNRPAIFIETEKKMQIKEKPLENQVLVSIKASEILRNRQAVKKIVPGSLK